jgi:DNA-binding CsgD family transcriptional regulator
MWTPDRDAELRRLGVETYISRHPGADVHEVLDRYLLLLDPEGRAALLREKNRNIEMGKWTPPRRKTGPKPAPPCPPKPGTVPAAIRTDSPQWPADTVERLRTMRARGLTAAEIAVILGKTEPAVAMKCAKLHIPSAASLTAQAWTMEQVQSLRDMYGRGFTAPQIAKAMGRTIKSVYGQTYRLRLASSGAHRRRKDV